MGLILNKITLACTGLVITSLIASCASDPIYIERRLPLPPEPEYEKVHLPICTVNPECISLEGAQKLSANMAKRKGYQSAMETTIKSTWGNK